LIIETVDFTKSAEQHRTAVLPGVDEELDSLKRNYDGMESLLTKLATRISKEIPQWAAQYIENCIFFPQLGFLTVVPLDPQTSKGRYEGDASENDVWEMLFASNNKGYYKNRAVDEMDNFFGDIYEMICSEF
jgi:DNA mismatch repair protein MSH5